MNIELFERRRKILQGDCYATTAILIACSDLSIRCLEWLPETILKHLDAIYGDLPITTYNKLFAAQTVINTNFYYRLLDHFHVINNSLFHGTMDDAITDSVEFGWGLLETQLLMPHPIPYDPGDLFSRDILDYLEYLWQQEGILKAPDVYSIGGFVFNNIDTVLGAFAGDPLMYEGMYKAAMEKSNLIDAICREKVHELVYELNSAGFPFTLQQVLDILSGQGTTLYPLGQI